MIRRPWSQTLDVKTTGICDGALLIVSVAE
jgi:hypothetical protein